MDIKSISASRIKTYEHCKFKYIINYMLYECLDCDETFYTPEMSEQACPYCKSKKFQRPELSTNWGAVHGTALHFIMENYATAIRGIHEDGKVVTDEEKTTFLDWETAVANIYKRGTANGQNSEDFAIYDIAKPKDVERKSSWCNTCSVDSDKPCEITGETLKTMNNHGCKGCPKELYNKSMTVMKKYIQRYDKLLRSRKILGIEKAFNLNFGKDVNGKDIISTGFIDLVTELDSDTIEIIDHKFGSWVPSFEEFSDDIQVKLYALVAKEVFPEYKEYIITFDYVSKNPLSIAFTPSENEETKQDIVAKWNQIASPQNVTRTIIDGNGKDPTTSWKCKAMCDVKICCSEWPKFKEKFK